MGKKPASLTALETLVADLMAELQREQGTPEVRRITDKLVLARKTLAAHRKAVDECEDKAR